MKTLLRILALALLVACSTTAAPVPSTATDTSPVHSPTLDRTRIRQANWRPVTPDPRTPEEIAAAACGQGKCVGTQVKPLAAAGGNPVLPPSWGVTAWDIDPANSVGCASDTNSGTSATCSGGCAGSVCTSGIGPLKTWAVLAQQRWGTYSPRISAATVVITFLSSQPDNTDPVILTPILQNGALVEVVGPALTSLTPVVSTTVSAHTARNRATPQLLSDTLTAGSASITVGMFTNNTTQTLTQWVHSGTGPFLMTQALAPATFPSTGGKPAEVNTTANSDAIKFYSFPNVDLVTVVPTIADYSGAFDNGVQIYHLNILDPSGAGNDHTLIGPQVWLIEVSSQRLIQEQTTPYDNTNLVTNCYLAGGFQGGSSLGAIATTGTLATRPSPHFQGGQVGSAASLFSDFQNTDLDGDVIMSNTDGANLAAGSFVGNVYLDTGVMLSSLYGTIQGNQVGAYGANTVWGPGGPVNASGTSRFLYTSGAGGAVAEFINTSNPVLQINNTGSEGCIALSAAASQFGTCNNGAGATLAYLDAHLGATAGCIALGGGGAFCNYGF